MANLRICFPALLLLLVAAASLRADVFKGRSAPQQITAPSGWTASALDKSAKSYTQLVLTDETGDVGVMLLYQGGADLDLSLKEYADTILKQMIADLTDTDHTEWKKIKVDGIDALRCQLSGTRDNLKLKYLVTILKGKDSYSQVLAFTKRSAFTDHLDELTKISDSFRVSPQPPATPRPNIIRQGQGRQGPTASPWQLEKHEHRQPRRPTDGRGFPNGLLCDRYH
jgi:hypothetical protein